MFILPDDIKKKVIVLESPPLSGKKEFIVKCVLSNLKKSKPIAIVLTDGSPEQLKEEMNSKKIELVQFEKKGLLMFVDCYSKHMGLKPPESQYIKRVSSPLALNEISIALTEIKEFFLKKYDTFYVLLHSLSSMLMYSNISTISRFIPPLISKIKDSGGNIVFTVEQGMHDSNTIATIEHFADIIIALKIDEEKMMIKTRGLDLYKDWTEIKL